MGVGGFGERVRAMHVIAQLRESVSCTTGTRRRSCVRGCIMIWKRKMCYSVEPQRISRVPTPFATRSTRGRSTSRALSPSLLPSTSLSRLSLSLLLALPCTRLQQQSTSNPKKRHGIPLLATQTSMGHDRLGRRRREGAVCPQLARMASYSSQE